MHTVFLALGSNLGDCSENLKIARDELSKETTITNCSSVYETPPWGFHAQPAFLNQVLEAQTHLTPAELLVFVKKIEKKMGRTSTFRNGPRLIDIDILLYDTLLMESKDLVIPHPRMLERGFVLVPLAEIAPDLLIPGTHLSIKDHLQNVDQTGILKRKSINPSEQGEELP